MTIPQARVAVGQLMGLSAAYDGSAAQTNDLTDDQKQELTQRLLTYILNNPGSFTVQQVATAQAESGRIGSLTLQDASVTASQVFVALGDSAYTVIGAPLSAIGNGVSNATTILGNLIPVLLLVGLAIVIVSVAKKQGAIAA